MLTKGATGVFDYKDVKKRVSSGQLQRFYDKDVQAPWAYSEKDGLMISYDDPESIAAKCAFVNKMKLGGVMVWELTSDDSYELTNAIVKGLGTSTPIDDPQPPPNTDTCPAPGSPCDPTKEYSKCTTDNSVAKCQRGRVKFWLVEQCPADQVCKVNRRGRARCVDPNGSGTPSTC